MDSLQRCGWTQSSNYQIGKNYITHFAIKRASCSSAVAQRANNLYTGFPLHLTFLFCFNA